MSAAMSEMRTYQHIERGMLLEAKKLYQVLEISYLASSTSPRMIHTIGRSLLDGQQVEEIVPEHKLAREYKSRGYRTILNPEDTIYGQVKKDMIILLKSEVCKVIDLSRTRAGKIDQIHVIGICLRDERRLQEIKLSWEVLTVATPVQIEEVMSAALP